LHRLTKKIKLNTQIDLFKATQEAGNPDNQRFIKKC